MDKVLKLLEGKKTYFVALLIGITAVLQYYGIFEQDVAEMIFGLLGAAGLGTLRNGVAGLKKKK